MKPKIILSLSLLLVGLEHATISSSVPPKTILFGACIGAHTHAPPMLAIANTLISSPHNHSVHFAAYVDDKGLVQSTPITFHSLGPSPINREDLRKKMVETQVEEMGMKNSWWGGLLKNPWIAALISIKRFNSYISIRYASTYSGFLRIMRQLQPDAVVCDFLAEACMDAATTLSIPLIIFSPFANVYSMSDASYTTSFMSPLPVVATSSMGLVAHIADRYLFPLAMWIMIRPNAWKLQRLRQEVGAPNPLLSGGERWKNAAVLINSWVGYDPPLPLPPNARLVGPLRRSEKTSPYALDESPSNALPGPLDAFLQSRSSVLYISLGTNAVATPQLIRRIILGVQKAVNAQLIDGAIWSLGNTDPAYLAQHHPDPQGSADHLLILPSVPQIAVLRHPSTRIFWGHCGASSTIEGILSGLPLIMTPIFADQPKTAMQLEALGVSKTLEKDGEDVQEVVDALDWALHSKEAATTRTIHTALAKSASQAGMAQAISVVESSAIAGPSYSAIPPTPVYFPGLNLILIPLSIILGSVVLIRTCPRFLGLSSTLSPGVPSNPKQT